MRTLHQVMSIDAVIGVEFVPVRKARLSMTTYGQNCYPGHYHR